MTCFTADEAFELLGIDRTTGYRSIRDGTFPVPVVRVGRLIRVPVMPLQHLLGVPERSTSQNSEYDAIELTGEGIVPARPLARSSQALVDEPATDRRRSDVGET